jgi:hypothetical protein
MFWRNLRTPYSEYTMKIEAVNSSETEHTGTHDQIGVEVTFWTCRVLGSNLGGDNGSWWFSSVAPQSEVYLG